jgi:hypothetical protein
MMTTMFGQCKQPEKYGRVRQLANSLSRRPPCDDNRLPTLAVE